jgi:hypothetical protein
VIRVLASALIFSGLIIMLLGGSLPGMAVVLAGCAFEWRADS